MAIDDVDLAIAPWDGRRVPMTLLGGYLGSGKTTLLNELLAQTDRPIAVLVNDVGQVNIDASLLKRRDGDTIELTDGCVCCSISEGLAATLAELRSRDIPPEHVVVELSGVADPNQVIPWANSDGFRLDGVIVLADATSVVEGFSDDYTTALLHRQMDAADLIVITKAAEVSDARLAQVWSTLSTKTGGAPVVDDRASLVGSSLLRLGTRRDHDLSATPPPTLLDPHVTELMGFPALASLEQITTMVDSLADDVVRAKGVALTADGAKHLIQVVGRRRTITPLPSAEDQPATDLVVIRLPR